MSESGHSFLPYGRHCIDEDDIAAVTSVLRSGYLTTGPLVEEFEAALAHRLDVRHALVCSSGTAALHLSLAALGIGPGDQVVVPTMTFLATANAVRFVGAEVVFADVDPETGLMEAGHAQAAIEGSDAPDRTQAVIPVHLNGQCSSMNEIAKLAQSEGLHVVEDACHALGTRTGDARGGGAETGNCRHSDAATFSFHPVKTIAMGEGGAVTTNDDDLIERLRRGRNHGMSRDPETFQNEAAAGSGNANAWYYEMNELGFNYRASDIHCALALSQLGKLDRFIEGRRVLAAHYDRLLAPLAPLVRPIERVADCRPAWHLYVVFIDFEKLKRTRTSVMEALLERNIGTQIHYLPVHKQPYYRRRYGPADLPGAEHYHKHAVTLPLFPAMDVADVERVVDALGSILEQS